MNTEAPQKQEKRKWLLTAFKVVFFVAAFLLVIFTVMTNMGGNSEVFKETIEDYISETTGYDARIGQFNGMTFFPVLGLDFDMLELHGDAGAEPVARVNRVQIAFGFWDVMWGTGKIRYLNIDSAHADAGVLLPAAVNLDRAAIIKTDEGGSALHAQGSIGGDKFALQAGMESAGEGVNETFKFGKEKPFFAILGPARIEGLFREADNSATLEDLKIVFKDNEVLKAHTSMKRAVMNDVAIDGEIVFPERQTTLQPDFILRHDGHKNYDLEGALKSTAVYSDDLDGNSRFMDFLKFMDSVFGDSNANEIKLYTAFTDVAITLAFDRLVVDGQDKGAFEQKFEMDSSNLVIKPKAPFMQSFAIEPAFKKPVP